MEKIHDRDFEVKVDSIFEKDCLDYFILEIDKKRQFIVFDPIRAIWVLYSGIFIPPK